jgi:hypothetical protein
VIKGEKFQETPPPQRKVRCSREHGITLVSGEPFQEVSLFQRAVRSASKG